MPTNHSQKIQARALMASSKNGLSYTRAMELVAIIQQSYEPDLRDAKSHLELEFTQSVPLADDDRIAKLTDAVLIGAIRSDATDLSIRHNGFAADSGSAVAIEYRLGGELYPVRTVDLKLGEELAARIRDLAGIDRSRRKEVADGNFSLRYGGEEIGFKVAYLPSAGMAKTVLRMFRDNAKTVAAANRAAIKAAADALALGRDLVVFGTSGSGKSTAVRTVLKEAVFEDQLVLDNNNPGAVGEEGYTVLREKDQIEGWIRSDDKPDLVALDELRDADSLRDERLLEAYAKIVVVHARTPEDAIARIQWMSDGELKLRNPVLIEASRDDYGPDRSWSYGFYPEVKPTIEDALHPKDEHTLSPSIRAKLAKRSDRAKAAKRSDSK